MKTAKSQLIDSFEMAQECGLSLKNLQQRIEPRKVLMCPPEYFQIVDSKNPFMSQADGKLNESNAQLALEQWQELYTLYERLGLTVAIVPAVPALEDMVFTANQVLPDNHNGRKQVILAEMKHASRRREVVHFGRWFEAQGYEVLKLQPNESKDPPCFEGQGDAIFHPERRLLWGAFGHRTEKAAYEQVSRLLDVPVALLELVHPRFYHLDTAFCVLDQHTVMLYPAAFSEKSLKLIHHLFEKVIEVTEADANNFACNGLCIDKTVILQRGSRDACKSLKQQGFNPIEVDTSEFMKSGGSVFCLKMLVY